MVNCKADIKDAKKFVSVQKSKSLKYGTTHVGGIDDVSAISFTKKGKLIETSVKIPMGRKIRQSMVLEQKRLAAKAAREARGI